MRMSMAILGLALAVAPTLGQSNPRAAEAITTEVVRQLYIQSDRHWHKGEYWHIIHLNYMVIAALPQFTNPYVDSAWLLWSMNRDDEAVALYDKGIAANPNTYELYYEKAFYFMTRKKDLKTALPLLEKAVAQKDCAKIVLHTLAHAYEKAGDLEKALATWNRAAEAADNPGRGAAIANRDRVKRLLESRK